MIETEAGCLWKCSVGSDISAVDAPTYVGAGMSALVSI